MVFGHKIVLDEVIRQDELDFIKAINDVSKGEIPEDTKNLILRLQRPLPPGDDPIRLCGRNFDCDIFNACKLMEMDGVSKCYQSIDEDVNKLCSKMCVPKLLHLKIGCPVMLVKKHKLSTSKWFTGKGCGNEGRLCDKKLNLDFDYETGSDSDNSDFSDGEILEVDEMLSIGEDMPASSSDLECRLTTVGSDILEHHVDHTKMKQLIPDNAITPEQMRLKVTLTDIFKKPTKELNTFFLAIVPNNSKYL
ncbi:hypothetical protein ACJMK2_021579 [Sinanodonta woodiana]|uniref:DNA helicase n=1 Tax=Sinanodonta woodiana TaxID=1069815 RepID=A0ABD3TIG4_SINWO